MIEIYIAIYVFINWSHNNKNVRLNFPVGVSYKEDPARIRKLLLEVVAKKHGVLITCL